MQQLQAAPIRLRPQAVRHMLDRSPWILLQEPGKLANSFEFLRELVGLSASQVSPTLPAALRCAPCLKAADLPAALSVSREGRNWLCG